MFEKKVTIFKKKDRPQWLKIKAALKEAGLKGVRSGHYLQDSVMAGGCGAKLDPRDFGPKGKIDHDIYYIKGLKDIFIIHLGIGNKLIQLNRFVIRKILQLSGLKIKKIIISGGQAL